MSLLGGAAARFSLRLRLTFLAAIGAAVVFPIGALLLHSELVSELDIAVTSELRIRGDDVISELRSGAPPSQGNALLTQVIDETGSVVEPAGADPILEPNEIARATRSELQVDRPVDGVGDRARILARPVTISGDRHVVAIAGSTAAIASARHRLAVVLGVVGPLLVLALASTAWMLTRAALRPVRDMTRQASSITPAQPSARLPQPPGDDEIAGLGRTLNEMLDRIEATIAHERAFVDDASHELRTPIAVLRGELELALLDMREGDDPAVAAAAIESALEETDRLSRLTEQLLVLARADAGELGGNRRPVGLLESSMAVVDRLGPTGPSVEVTGTERLVLADRDLIERLITNLVANAKRWADSTVLVDVGGDDSARLVVSDDGPGFEPAILDRALDRFGRGDSARSRRDGGAGLGLAIVSAITESLDGSVSLGNGGHLGGAVVEVQIPLRASST